MIEEYRACAAICAETNYSNKQSVRKHNQAVGKMYKIINVAISQGQEHVKALIPLLDEPLCAKWLAHHLLEKTIVEHGIEQKCLAIIESLASGNGPDASGEKFWLKNYRENKR